MQIYGNIGLIGKGVWGKGVIKEPLARIRNMQ